MIPWWSLGYHCGLYDTIMVARIPWRMFGKSCHGDIARIPSLGQWSSEIQNSFGNYKFWACWKFRFILLYVYANYLFFRFLFHSFIALPPTSITSLKSPSHIMTSQLASILLWGSWWRHRHLVITSSSSCYDVIGILSWRHRHIVMTSFASCIDIIGIVWWRHLSRFCESWSRS